MKISLNKNDLWIVLLGLVIRIGIALVSSHPYDTAQFAIAQRLFFQHGIIELKYFPTLPLLYYIQLPFYSIYTALQILGMNDYQQFYRSTLMVEGVFLKLPLILSDIGSFWAIRLLTRKRMPAVLYFLNPFIIYISSAWGMYDTLMIFPLLLGFLLLEKYGRTRSSIALVVSGMVKLLGFIPFSFLLIEGLLKKRFKEAALQIAAAIIIAIGVLIPVVLVGGFREFLVGFLLRYVGLGDSVQGYFNYNPLGIFIGPALSIIKVQAIVLFLVIAFVVESRRFAYATTTLTSIVKWSFIGVIALNIFALNGEVEWLSWIIPLGIVYGFLTDRTGLQYFTFLYGTTAAFVTMLYTQGTGYLLGTSLDLLPDLQAVTNGLEIYAATTLCLLLIALAYAWYRPVKFRCEIIGAVFLIYLQAYFWFGLVGIQL
jgi:hypothetical protein